MSETDNAPRSLTRWKDEPSIYPSAEAIAKAVNDKGERAERTKKGKKVPCHKFNLVEKLAAHVFNAIEAHFKPEGLTVNVRRGKQKLLQDIIISRKAVDATETDPFFHQFASDGKAFAIENEKSKCGLDVCIEHFQGCHELQQHLKNTARTANDGLRLAAIMMDPKCRGEVSGVLSKSKKGSGRAKNDVSGDPNLHFFEKILTEAFLNQEHFVQPPSAEHYEEMPDDEKGAWDPNDFLIFEHERTAAWLKDTWDTHLREKCKAALDRWNKDTGGGDGAVNCFIDFCGSDRWLQWMFAVDCDCNFLLANSAGGGVPRHLTLESEPGFDTADLSSLADGTPPSSRGKRKAEDELDAARKDRLAVRSALDKVVDRLDGQSGETEQEKNIKKIASHSKMMQDEEVLSTVTPVTKQKCVEAIEKERSDAINKLQC